MKCKKVLVPNLLVATIVACNVQAQDGGSKGGYNITLEEVVVTRPAA